MLFIESERVGRYASCEMQGRMWQAGPAHYDSGEILILAWLCEAFYSCDSARMDAVGTAPDVWRGAPQDVAVNAGNDESRRRLVTFWLERCLAFSRKQDVAFSVGLGCHMERKRADLFEVGWKVSGSVPRASAET